MLLIEDGNSPGDSFDKLLGMVNSALMGDVLGIPYEFSRAYFIDKDGNKEKVRDLYPDSISPRIINDITNIPNRFNTTKLNPTYSDDTCMTIQLFKAIAENNHVYRSKRAIESYLEWTNLPKPLMGRNTKKLLKGCKNYKDYKERRRMWDFWPHNEPGEREEEQIEFAKRNKIKLQELQGDPSQSNGSLMRATSLVFAKNWKKACKKDTYLTNPNRINYHSTLIYVLLLRKEIFKEDIDENLCLHAKVAKYYNLAKEGEVKYIKSSKKGWVVYSLYISLFIYFHANSYSDAIKIFNRKFYAKNNDLDSDTILSIALGLLGAKLGYSELIKERDYRKNIELIQRIKVDTERFVELDIELLRRSIIELTCKPTTPTLVRIQRSKGEIVQDCDVYIGRHQSQGGWNLKKSKWHNPYKLNDYTLKESLKLYEKRVRDKLYDDLILLSGKSIGCWCSNESNVTRKKENCHGHVLIRLFKEKYGSEKKETNVDKEVKKQKEDTSFVL